MRIAAEALGRRLAGLDAVGRRESGYHRLAWTPEMRAAEAWFAGQAAQVGLRPERDPAGNLWGCPEADPPWWGIGSHLDTVRAGGRYDGALGVAAAFEVAAHIAPPVAVLALADEEGARYNTPTFGSRALAGALDPADVLARTDDEGVRLADALAKYGVDPGGLLEAPAALARLRCFVEVHIDQTRDLARAGVAAGIVRALAARLRLKVEVRGAADHAGTTLREERHDALAAAARLIVRGDELARARPGVVSTTARLEVQPNALTTVPARVTMWMDARAPEPEAVGDWERALGEAARQLAELERVEIDLTRASFSEGTVFDAEVRRAAADAARALGVRAPDLTCLAGHDAGILAARLPTGMVLVRNPTGTSHSPDEDVSLEDAAVAASIALATLERLP